MFVHVVIHWFEFNLLCIWSMAFAKLSRDCIHFFVLVILRYLLLIKYMCMRKLGIAGYL